MCSVVNNLSYDWKYESNFTEYYGHLNNDWISLEDHKTLQAKVKKFSIIIRKYEI